MKKILRVLAIIIWGFVIIGSLGKLSEKSPFKTLDYILLFAALGYFLLEYMSYAERKKKLEDENSNQ